MRIRFARSSLGLEIADHAVKLVRLVKDRKQSFRIKTQHIVPLPEQAIVDGKIMQPDIVAGKLAELAKKANAAGKRVQLVVPGSVVMVRYLKLPDLPMNKLGKVLQFELADNIRLPFDDPQYDFVKLPGTTNAAASAAEDGVPMCDVLLAAASKEIIRQYADLTEQAGMKPAALEIKGLALYRLLRHMGIRSEHGALLAVDMSPGSAELCIYKSGGLRMSRNVSLETSADPAAGRGGFGAFGASGALAQVAAAGQIDPLEALYDNLAQEIDRFVAFYRYTLNQRDDVIAEVLLCGDMERPEAAAESLRERLSYSLRLLGAEGELPAKRGSYSLSPQTCVTVGLALRGLGL